MNISSIFTQMLVLFLTIGVGYAGRRTKLWEETFNKALSNLLMFFTCPAMILHSVIGSERVLTNGQVYQLTLIALGIYAVLFLVVLPLPKLLRVPKAQVGVYRFLMIFGNVGFMGFPVTEAIFGPEAVFFAAIFQIPFNALCFTYGAWLMSEGRAGFSLKQFFSPVIICTLLSYVLYLVDFHAPAFLIQLTDFVGDVTSPLAMVLVGSALATVPLKEVFTEPRMYLVSLFKLALRPVLTWLVLRTFVSSELILGISVVMMGMPAATNSTILAAQYDGDSATAAKGVFLTTLLAVGTIPLLMYALF